MDKPAEKRIYRRAGIRDVEDIYRICSKMQLENRPKIMSRRGFLINHYASNPDIKKKIETDIYDTVFLICETRKGTLGFLQGYLSSFWLKLRPGLCGANGCKIHWNEENLKKIDIDDILNFDSFGVIDKVAVDKTLNKKRVAFDLIKLFVKILLESEKKYVMSEIVTHIYEGENLLNITNKASISFHKKLGFFKVGSTPKYHMENTFLKERGYFRDAIFMAKINALPYKYKRLFQAVK